MPEDLQVRAVELPVERNDGWRRLFGPPLRIDEYAVKDLVVEEGSAGSGRTLRFGFHRRGTLLWRIRCHDGRFVPNGEELRCEATGDEATGWVLRAESHPDGQVEKHIDWQGGRFAVTPTTRSEGEGPAGLLIGADEVPVLMIDVRGDGTVWMADDLTADVRDVLVGATAALLLTRNGAD